MGIGKRIRARREKVGMSQTDLAEKAGISKQTLYKYENEIITNIPHDKIEKIARILNVAPGELMGWQAGNNLRGCDDAALDDEDHANVLCGIGKRLKALRMQRQLTMDMVVFDVARIYQIEFTKGNLSRWENELNYPSLVFAACLADYYNVSLDYLVGNTDVKTPVRLLTIKKAKKED